MSAPPAGRGRRPDRARAVDPTAAAHRLVAAGVTAPIGLRPRSRIRRALARLGI